MVQTDFTNGAGQAGVKFLTPETEDRQFYNVSDFIADLRGGAFGAPHITADAAYRLGVIDGRHGLDDYSQHAAPFTAEYTQGYAVGQGKVTERLPLGTPVMLHNGVTAVVAGHSTCDCKRYELVWFDRHVWQVRRRWIDRGAFEVIVNARKTATAA